MKTVTIGFSHSNNMFSKLIMWATRSKISHTYIRLTDEIVYQASGLSVNEQTYEYFLTYETVIDEIQIQVTDEQWAEGEKFRKESLGRPYSMREIFGFIWVLSMRGLGKKVANPLKDGDRATVCVSLVCRYVDIDDGAENLTPDDLHQILSKNQSA